MIILVWMKFGDSKTKKEFAKWVGTVRIQNKSMTPEAPFCCSFVVVLSPGP